ncbi:MAG: hypothetical protein WD066_18690 [Planctomycetaceae bacterium]
MQRLHCEDWFLHIRLGKTLLDGSGRQVIRGGDFCSASVKQWHDRCTLPRAQTDATLISMSPVSEIEAAIRGLTREELALFREWFFEFDAESWDRQLEQDVAAGRLDAFANKAIRERRAGRSTD